jgi:hypothetical protein
MQLDNLLDLWRTKKFSWGNHDCVHFILDYINLEIVDLPSYSTEYEALKVLVSFTSLESGVDKYLGPRIYAGYKRGDVVMAMRPVHNDPGRTGPGLGICISKDVAVFVGSEGLEEVEKGEWLWGWEIE